MKNNKIERRQIKLKSSENPLLVFLGLLLVVFWLPLFLFILLAPPILIFLGFRFVLHTHYDSITLSIFNPPIVIGARTVRDIAIGIMILITLYYFSKFKITFRSH
jgi:hypothetical protein